MLNNVFTRFRVLFVNAQIKNFVIVCNTVSCYTEFKKTIVARDASKVKMRP